MKTLRADQNELVGGIRSALRKTKRVIVQSPTGCHAAGTSVLMFSGRTKLVEKIVVGDVLMGPDGGPRHVLALHHGTDEMFKITPKRAAAPFVVNGGHILALTQTNLPEIDRRSIYNGHRSYRTIWDFLSETSEFRHIHKLELCDAINFESSGIQGIPAWRFLDPYLLGVLLGDGAISHQVAFTSADIEIVRAVEQIVTRYAFCRVKRVQDRDDRCPSYRITSDQGKSGNAVWNALRYLRLAGTKSETKFIPFPYKVAPRNDRLRLLAGLIDTDGHLTNGTIDYVTKSKVLAEDIAFVARSVGLTVTVYEKIINTGRYAGYLYYRLSLSGDLDCIPTELPRKQADPRMQIKNHRRIGFHIEAIGAGEFFGFEVDEDNLYLTADFVVHHNSGKTVIMADIVSRARDKDKRVLITVPAISLVDQTMMAIFQQGVEEIGVIQANHPMTNLSKPVQVCSIQTLHNYWRNGEMPEADLVLVDEVHRWYKTFPEWMLDPKWLKVPFIGFSATPWTKALGTLYSELITGNTIGKLIEDKVLVPFRTFAPDMPSMDGVRKLAGEFVAADLEEVMRPKKLVANVVDTWKQLAKDRPTVAFCCSRAHADQLAKEFNEAGVGAGYLDCESPLSERNEVRRRMLAGDIRVVCNVDVVGLGVDWPEVSCISYCRPTMSDMRFVQNIGRGLRAAPGKEDLLILDHSSTTARLGFVDEIYNYHPKLDDGKTKEKAEVVLLPKQCPACFLMKPPRTAVCPHCGHKTEHHADPVAVERGTLREIKPGDEAYDWRKRLPDKPHVFGQLWWWGHKKGYRQGWAAVKTKEIFGSFPRAREPDPEHICAPTPELVEYIYMSTEKWKREQNSARRRERRTGNGDGALSDREQAMVDRAAEQASLMTDQDYADMENFR